MPRCSEFDRAALAAIRARQYQVITRSQALASGMTENALGEVDSAEYHLSPEDHERPLARDVRMTKFGINVLHFTPRQIRTRPAEVIAAIRSALAAANFHPPVPIRTMSAAAPRSIPGDDPERRVSPGPGQSETPGPPASSKVKPRFHPVCKAREPRSGGGGAAEAG